MPQVEIELEVFTKDEEFIEPLLRIFQALQRRLLKNLEENILGEELETVTHTQKTSVNKGEGSTLDRVNDINYKIVKGKKKYKINIYSNDIVLFFLEYGTGIYSEKETTAQNMVFNGKVKRVLVPRFSKVFKFEVDGEIVYTPYIYGMMPIPIFRSALFKLRNSDLKPIFRDMGISYKSYSAPDKEKVTVEILGFTMPGKKKFKTGKNWMEKHGKRLRLI